jgi:hypothetical protein
LWKKRNESPGVRIFWSLIPTYVSVFAYLNYFKPKGGHTRFQRIAFYVLFYLENFAMLFVWFFVTEYQGVWWHTKGLVAAIIAFPLHLLLMLFYYGCCHPNKGSKQGEIKNCVCGWTEWRKALIYADRVIWDVSLPKNCEIIIPSDNVKT